MEAWVATLLLVLCLPSSSSASTIANFTQYSLDCQTSIEAWAQTQVIPSPMPTPSYCAITLPPYPACATSSDPAASSWSERVLISKPSCYAAGVGLNEYGTLCQSLRDAYMTGTNYQLYPGYLSNGLGYNEFISNGWIGSLTTMSSTSGSSTGDFLTTTYTWPYLSSLAPGCML